MSPLIVYAYSKCSTCRKALRWLDERGIEYELVDIVTTPPGKKLLAAALEVSGLPVNKLFNTSGQSYRDGKWGERLKKATQAEALDALSKDGKLVKRPFVVGEGFVLVGFDEAAYAERLGKKKR